MPITFRPGRPEDNFAVYRVFYLAINDLIRRIGDSDNPNNSDDPDPESLESFWQTRRSLYEHLLRTAEFFWVAEDEGEIIGYSRSRLYGDIRELTELFVMPGAQSKGVGHELLARAFPRDNARLRIIIAAPELRAQILYMRTGVYARHPIYYFERASQHTPLNTDLVFEPATDSPQTLAAFAKIDHYVLGFQRDDDHRWFLSERSGWLYKRQGEIVGYGYGGENPGPFALLQPQDFPAVLAHAENQAVERGSPTFFLSAHSVNKHVVDYLLARGFQLNPFIASLMSNQPFGRFTHYINTDPPFFL